MTLYTVTISTEIVVAAEDAASAEKFAANIAYANIACDDYRISASPMTRLPEDWTAAHTPWGLHPDPDEQDRTIAEWIALGRAWCRTGVPAMSATTEPDVLAWRALRELLGIDDEASVHDAVCELVATNARLRACEAREEMRSWDMFVSACISAGRMREEAISIASTLLMDRRATFRAWKAGAK